MYTSNDALFCVLHSSEYNLESRRLIYYMYVYQLAGLDFKFKYRIDASGLICKPLNDYLGAVVNSDKVIVNDGIISLTSEGRFYHDNIMLTASEWDKVNYIRNVLDSMNEQELYFVCIVDMFVYDVLAKFGVDGLISQKNKIKKSISALSKAYTDDNFDSALKFIRIVKGEIKNEF